jgi:class 3 adenylate cyclase
MESATDRHIGYSISAATVFALAVVGLTLPLIRGETPEVAWLVMVAFGVLGAVVLWRRPGNGMGWVFSAMGLSGFISGAAPKSGFWELFGGLGWFSFFFFTIAILPALFPTGRPLTRGWRRVLYGAMVVYACFAFLWIFQGQVCEEWVPGPEGRDVCAQRVDSPIGIPGIEDPEESLPGTILLLGFLMAGVAGLVSLGIRLRRARGVERQQLKWLLFALGTLVGFIVLVDVVAGEWLGLRMPELAQDLVLIPIWLGVPTAAGVAIFRYGLYDIDRIISRTVAYGLLVIVLTVAYLGAVVGIGALVSIWGPSPEDLGFPLPVVATAIVAIAFQPVRLRAKTLANRLVFGKRHTPYQALAGVGGASLEELLPQIARLAAESTVGQEAIVWVSDGAELRPAAIHPDTGHRPAGVPLGADHDLDGLGRGIHFPLRYQSELLGVITVHVAVGEDLPAEDARLLSDLADHAAVAVRGLLDSVPLPTGVVTFLMTDIVGSTRLWEEDPEGTSDAIRQHDALVKRVVTDGGGVLVKWKGEGDSTFSVFLDAAGAVAAAQALQEGLRSHDWPTPRPISVRAALHTGEAELRGRDYFGMTVIRCARLRAIAVGGQTLVSAATRELARERLPEALAMHDLGEKRLKDIVDPERVYEIVVTTTA